jgi:hypothetical protein
MKQFTFRYTAISSEVSFDNFTFNAKIGLRKKSFPSTNILYFYVHNTQQYQSMYLTYTDDSGKTKKLTFFADLGDSGFMAFAAELKAAYPEKCLNHLPEKEAFATMKVANPNKWAPIVAFALIVGVFAIILFPALAHFADGGHENVTVQQVIDGGLGTHNVTIEGTLVDAATEETVTSSRNSTKSHSTFIPIVDENWQEGDPIKVVLEFKELSSSELSDRMSESSFTGVVRNIWWEGLEKDKVDFFKSEFGLNVPETPILIEVTDKESHNDVYAVFALGLVIVIMGVIFLIIAIKRKKRQA